MSCRFEMSQGIVQLPRVDVWSSGVGGGGAHAEGRVGGGQDLLDLMESVEEAGAITWRHERS